MSLLRLGIHNLLPSLPLCFHVFSPQGLLQEAIHMKKDFFVLYTPCSGKPTGEAIQKAEQTFKKLHPTFTAYIFNGMESILKHPLFISSCCCLASTQIPTADDVMSLFGP